MFRKRRSQASTADKPVRVLFVCMGNICRSPTAEAVFRERVEAAGLADLVDVDSAGTHAYHVGHPPDGRAQQTARERGISMDGQRARKVSDEDFERFDLIVAMDRENLGLLEPLQREGARARLSLMLEFHADAPIDEVPDPYYGGASGFERVFDLVSEASDGLLEEVRRLLAARPAEPTAPADRD